MAFQGISRTSPPICTGQGSPTTGDHCCYVNGEVCPLLKLNDPRDTRPGAIYSCGLFLDIQESFSQWDFARIWARVHRHPLFDQIKAVWEAKGITICGDFLGGVNPDGTIIGQCCFEGYTFDSAGNVIAGPGA